jgi:hypothetical protein
LVGIHRHIRHAERDLPPQSLARPPSVDTLQQRSDAVLIFYDGNFAIHGTTHVSRLGGPASRELCQAASCECHALVRKVCTRISIQ